MVVVLADAEHLLDLGNVAHVGIVNLFRVQLLHLFFCNEAALVAESLLSQILAAVVPHFLASTSQLLFDPVVANLEQHESLFADSPSRTNVAGDSWLRLQGWHVCKF